MGHARRAPFGHQVQPHRGGPPGLDRATVGGGLFFLPLTLLGFHPLAVIGMFVLNLLYQFFLHTEHAPRLGPLEWVLNTPAHHRVHHASNASCLDKNFAGVFIVWDRLFGTFAAAPTDEKLRFGCWPRPCPRKAC